MMSSRETWASLSFRSPSMNPTRSSAWCCRRSAALREITCGDREQRRDGHHEQRCCGDRYQAPVAPLQFALLECVETNAEQARDEFQPGVRFAVTGRPHVRGDRFGALGRRRARRVDGEAQSGRQTFVGGSTRDVRGVRLAVDDQAENAFRPTEAFERAYFLVHPARRCRMRRANHDQVGRLPHRRVDRAPQITGAGQLVTIAEYRDRVAGRWCRPL